MKSIRLRQDELMPVQSDIIPMWVGYYLGLPYLNGGRSDVGFDDWGLTRVVLAEQYSIAIPSHRLLNSKAIFDITNRLENLNHHGKYIVAIKVDKKEYLFGVKLPNGRMLTMFKSGSCLIKYDNNMMGDIEE